MEIECNCKIKDEWPLKGNCLCLLYIKLNFKKKKIVLNILVKRKVIQNKISQSLQKFLIMKNIEMRQNYQYIYILDNEKKKTLIMFSKGNLEEV